LSSELAIRRMKKTDEGRVEGIISKSFPWFGLFARQSIKDKEGEVLVADVEGKVAGFAKLIEFSVANVKYGCILWIGVHPSFRRRGVALKLTCAGVDALKADGSEAVFASTQRRNVAALATLRSASFVSVGFCGLWRLFGLRVLDFFGDIWLAPGETVLVHG